nr:MAG TPA: hypothetical protein [Caudoviricetes sp.]
MGRACCLSGGRQFALRGLVPATKLALPTEAASDNTAAIVAVTPAVSAFSARAVAFCNSVRFACSSSSSFAAFAFNSSKPSYLARSRARRDSTIRSRSAWVAGAT